MRIISFRSYEHLKLYIILCIFCVLVMFFIYQIIHYFLNKCMSLPSKFQKCFYNNNEDKAVSVFFFDAYFDWWCVNVALNTSRHRILIISRINSSYYVYERNFTGIKRDCIRCAIIPCSKEGLKLQLWEDTNQSNLIYIYIYIYIYTCYLEVKYPIHK